MRISDWSSDVCSSDLAAKICNNMLLGASMVATAEAFTLAIKLGLDPQTFFDISSKASGQNWSMTSRSEEHTSELQSLMRISYAVFCLKKHQKQYRTYLKKLTLNLTYQQNTSHAI